jgi:hypothetical protein
MIVRQLRSLIDRGDAIEEESLSDTVNFDRRLRGIRRGVLTAS